MKGRGFLILAGLIAVVLALTVFEKYGDYRRREHEEQAVAGARREWESRLNRMFDARWRQMSTEVRRVLDSLAEDVVAGGVDPEEFVQILSDQPPALPAENLADSVPVTPSPPASSSGEQTPEEAQAPEETQTPDPLALDVTHAYRDALKALPGDLTAYERRVATGEVATLIRVRFGLSPALFDSMLTSVTP